MTTGKLIALVGYKGAGKTTTTATAILDPRVSMRAMPIYHMSFSKPIMNMLTAMGIPEEILSNKKRWDEPLEYLCGKTVRHAATTLGTEWGRDQIGQKLWTNIALKEANAVRKQGVAALIDNCRFPSEYDDLRSNGAIMIAYRRPDLIVDLSHSSEWHIAELQRKCDIAIENNGTFAQGVTKMRNILAELVDK